MVRQSILGCLIFLFGSIQAQVVNTEKLRSDRKDHGWYLDANVSLSVTRNKAGRSLSFNAQARGEYLFTKHKLLLFGGYSLGQFRNVSDSLALPSNWLNNRFGHLRYNYHFTNWLTLEVFSQAQFDEVQEIRIRWLNGIGPRFTLLENDSATLYLGALYMYEYEETTDLEPQLVFNRHHRLSGYVSAAYALTSYFTINHVTYFQPRLDQFRDFRISSETTLSVTLTQKLSFNTYFQLIYDSNPPITVPEVMYTTRSGLNLSF